MITFVPQTGSTNQDLADRIRSVELVREGDWLVARRQTKGKGRQGREWFDGEGNFMGSTVVQCREGDPPAPTLALLAGLAVQEAVDWHLPEGCKVKLKWPNDVLLDDAKLAGILLERVDDTIIVGIGVNLVSSPDLPDRKTTSLADVGSETDCDVFAKDLARIFDLELERWRNFGLAPVLRRWLAAAHEIGTPMTVIEPGEGYITGVFAGLDEDGALQLGLADGSTRVIHAGDVILGTIDEQGR